MVQSITDHSEHPFEWIDIVDPDQDELNELTTKYALHESSINDWLQPDHLPKYEHVRSYTFIIFRMHAEKVSKEADTVPELTDKVAIFMFEKLVITLHKNEWLAPQFIKENQIRENACENTHQLVNEIIKSCIATYEAPSIKLTSDIEYYEENMFLKNRKPSLLKGLYYLRRRVEVTRRIIMLSHDIVERLDSGEQSNTYTRDTRDLYVKLHNIYDTLFENMNQLVMIYFSISSQRTNEIVRVLTVFSVFFMPLTFIVGIYGMNFEYMPELKLKLGYPGVMVLMGAITVGIYVWFKKRGWL
ncbi:magnesium transporter CorA family protein [Dyadobacter aurulentus]|uniref:magnesium transporter CorA family protein n=1 Tax=Dyadobacter sp. UC 10 TaxID=2605428 RepID=UPI0011F234B4|nr:CorA family divalent cation transporter [Dyadobacter sp. UC 10]KAA0993700.1 magnesium transporter CorA [Dyadobacter sp. UC 10]